MKAGDAAESDDIWLRPITNETHLKPSTGTVHHAAFKKWLSPPDDSSKPWKLEVSGRLRSLVTSISADAVAKVDAQKAKLVAEGKPVPSALKYCGILHSDSVAAVRSIIDFDGDVIYDPNEDTAHANIIIRDKDESEILTVTAALIKSLKFLTPAQVGADKRFSTCV